MTTRLELFALPGLPMVQAGRRPRRPDRRCAWARGDCALRTATWWWWRRRSCPRPKAARSISPTSTPSAEAETLGGRGRQGPAAGRGGPVGIQRAGRAQPAQPDDRAAPAGLRDGQCRRRSVERRAARRRAARAAAAGRSRRHRRRRCAPSLSDRLRRRSSAWSSATASAAPGAAARWASRSVRRTAGADRPARPARPVRPHAGGQHHRLRR